MTDKGTKSKSPTVAIAIGNCARCGLSHPVIRFIKLIKPVKVDGEPDLTYWAHCPTNGDPILLRV